MREKIMLQKKSIFVKKDLTFIIAASTRDRAALNSGEDEPNVSLKPCYLLSTQSITSLCKGQISINMENGTLRDENAKLKKSGMGSVRSAFS
jgi:hypothetical protein